jgi:hypothetical protein
MTLNDSAQGWPATKLQVERIPGRAGWCVMGIEQLNSAAWAAGFAMAACEEDYRDGCTAVQPVEAPWTPGQAIMVRQPEMERTDWVRALMGLFGRRDRVSPA